MLVPEILFDIRHRRRHPNEKEIRNILSFPTKSKERQQALAELRNSSNFNLYLKGTIRPKKQKIRNTDDEYYPCIYCKAIYAKRFLTRHIKNCVAAKILLDRNQT